MPLPEGIYQANIQYQAHQGKWSVIFCEGVYKHVHVFLSYSLTLGAHAQEGYCSRPVCLSVCPLSHISPLERLFALKILSCTQWATEIEKFVGFSLKPLHCRDPALPPLKAIRSVGHFPVESAHAHYSIN